MVRALLAELASPPVVVFPDCNTAGDKSQPFKLHCDIRTNDLGATLEQKQPDRSTRLMVSISRATLNNKRSWTPVELEAVCVVCSICRLSTATIPLHCILHQCRH